MVQYKLGIIYVRLSHIHLIQTFKILPLKNIHDGSQHMIISYILLYDVKYCTQGIQLDTQGGIDED